MITLLIMANYAGFKFSYGTCGFKKTGKPDLAIIYSDFPCTYAGVFTSNQVHAACIDENKKILKGKKKIRAIVINSGNANACTGKKGIKAVKDTKTLAGKLLNIKPDEVLIASTGSIGVQLDMKKMESGLNKAVKNLSSNNFQNAAKAILTTDRFEKTILKKTKNFLLFGFAKGAGMIHPNMATMLCYFMTDLKMSQSLLQTALRNAIDDTFNVISVDGDMSTSDMVVLLSNNKSNKEVKSSSDPLFKTFQQMLNDSFLELAKKMVLDGEGANKIISAQVKGVKNKSNARKIARSIISSTLFKCAIYGSDPNWGRAVARIGVTSVKINPEKIDITLAGTPVYKKGEPIEFDRIKLNKKIKSLKEIPVEVNLNQGKEFAYAYGCDMSTDYVKFNSAYFT